MIALTLGVEAVKHPKEAEAFHNWKGVHLRTRLECSWHRRRCEVLAKRFGERSGEAARQAVICVAEVSLLQRDEVVV
jgi:hypothetical protein